MSATTQYTDFSDLYTGLQNAVRVQTGVTATENQAKRYINIGLQDMHLGFQERYPWAERSAILITQPKYATGTVAISKGGVSVTGTSTAWATANDFSVNNARIGGKIVIDGGFQAYEVTAVGSDTTMTIGSQFTEDTVTAATYVYFEDEYDLASDFGRPVDARQLSEALRIDLVSRTEFRQRYARNNIVGVPTVGCIHNKVPSGSTALTRRVQLHKPPEKAISITYSYITTNLVISSAGAAQVSFSADADEPLVPLQYRHAIFFHALYHWYRDKKDDTRSAEAKAEYTDIMVRLTSDNEIGDVRPRLIPRISHYSRNARSPYRSGGSRYDINNRFDRFED